MIRRTTTILLTCCLFALPLFAQAAEADALTLEQQLFNDFAVRMQEHLHKTAALLERIAKTTDAQERDKLMKEYQQSVRISMKIHHLMHQVSGGAEMQKAGGGMMMKGKKKMGGMSCCSMMGKKSAGAAAKTGDAATDGAEDHSAHGASAAPEQDEQAEGGDDAASGGGHEGH